MTPYRYRWLMEQDARLFLHCNRSLSHAVLDRLLSRITHLGGATFTIVCPLLLILFAPDPWRTTGWHSLAALTVSHLLAVLLKRAFRRPRPYAVLRQAKTVIAPLADYSFPSGHTTAIFAIAMPFALLSPWLALALVPLALIVGLSRIYLGVHYPSDCLAGCLIGIGAATCIAVIM